MYSFKKSLAALVGISLLVLASAVLLPRVGQGQAGDRSPLQRDTRRAFYLTQTRHTGVQALTACASGYHMASLWEILDPSNFKYDTQLGITTDDSGSGPPTFREGWIRTGNSSTGSISVGGGPNCRAWTSGSDTDYGTIVFLEISFFSTRTDPWRAETTSCSNLIPVWCVQD